MGKWKRRKGEGKKENWEEEARRKLKLAVF